MIDVFIGYDSHEEIAFHVLSSSIHKYASKPVRITPIRLSQLKKIFNRDNNKLQSTEFSFSRFLVPYLNDFKGYSIFMDCDMLFFDDINKLWEQRNSKYSVMVAKHNYNPKDRVKFLSNTQSSYEKKNWSSMMIFNNEKCKSLTLDYVNTASGLELHQFKWLEDDNLIGDIDLKWNFLVDEYDYKKDIFNAHYTVGGPYFKKYEKCSYSDKWKESLKEVLFAKNEASFLTKIYKELK